jgi:hypothetical protein
MRTLHKCLLLGCLLAFAIGSYGQQPKPTPEQLRQLSLSYKLNACQIDSELLAQDNAELRKQLAETKK